MIEDHFATFQDQHTFLMWRREKREGRIKIIAGASPCHEDQHASPSM